jgi:glucan biosynthesis protein C
LEYIDLNRKEHERIYFLDNFRAFTVVLVIILHTSMCYMSYAPTWWYVIDPENSFLFTRLVMLIDVSIMQILFFIAGYFIIPSIQKRTTLAFLKDKLKRIGIPWIIGFVIIAPLLTYIIFLSRKIEIDFFYFYFNMFWGDWYQQSVYWFLGILLILYISFALVYRFVKRLTSTEHKKKTPKWLIFITFLLFNSLGFFLMNLLFPIDSWENIGFIIVYQPERVPLYIGYFIFGIYAYKNHWGKRNSKDVDLLIWGSLFMISAFSYIYIRFTFSAEIYNVILFKALNALLFNIFCLSSLLFGYHLFNTFINNKKFLWRTLAKNSYGIYYLHPLVVYPLAYFFLDIAISIYFKTVLIIVITIVFSWATSQFILKKIPFVRQIF